MEIYVEDLIAEIRLDILELQSSMTILNQALTNEFEEVEKEDIHNHLQILMGKLELIVKQFDKIYEMTENQD